MSWSAVVFAGLCRSGNVPRHGQIVPLGRFRQQWNLILTSSCLARRSSQLMVVGSESQLMHWRFLRCAARRGSAGAGGVLPLLRVGMLGTCATTAAIKLHIRSPP